MTVQLFISSELIEEIPISFDGCRCCEEKDSKLKATAEWLKYRYRQSLAMMDNWEIVAVQESRA